MNRQVGYVICALFVAGFSGRRSEAQPSAEVCDDAGAQEICVRFDNLSDPPVSTFDFRYTFDNGVPSVEFIRGDNGQGTNYQWRVWCKDAEEEPAAVGSITAYDEYDYLVRVLDPDDGPGADHFGPVKARWKGAKS